MYLRQLITALLAVLAGVTLAQLTGRVGPTTSAAGKAANKICDVTDYGATEDSNFSQSFSWAFGNCSSAGGRLVYIPPGEYPMRTKVNLKHGDNMAV